MLCYGLQPDENYCDYWISVHVRRGCTSNRSAAKCFHRLPRDIPGHHPSRKLWGNPPCEGRIGGGRQSFAAGHGAPPPRIVPVSYAGGNRDGVPRPGAGVRPAAHPPSGFFGVLPVHGQGSLREHVSKPGKTKRSHSARGLGRGGQVAVSLSLGGRPDDRDGKRGRPAGSG